MKIIPCSLEGSITPPPSKSYLHRYLLGSLLCKDTCTINNIYLSEDIKATLNVLNGFQKNYIIENNSITINGIPKNNNSNIDCIESGSTLRFSIPIAMALYKENTFIYSDSLNARPLNTYLNIFNEKNIKFIKDNNILKVYSNLCPGIYKLNNNISSQFITGLLFALPILNNDSQIVLTQPIESKPYIDISIDVLRTFGIEIKNIKYTKFYIKGNQTYKPINVNVEKDWSNSVFWECLKTKYNLHINNLNKNSLQGDKIILEILKNFPKEFNGKNHPDIIPCLCAYAIGTKKEIIITNCQRLKYKESNRLLAMNEFKKVGGNIKVLDDKIIIYKSNKFVSNILKTYNDHRLIMAFTLFAFLTNTEIEIDNTNAINKSYPNFFETLANLEKK